MKKILLGFMVFLVVVAVGAFLAIKLVDPNKYRGQIAEILNKQTGRIVKLDGPIHLGLSLEGLTFGFEKASISNPSWASRPEMASLEGFELGVGLLPLLDHKLVLTGLKISGADVELESNLSGQGNWELRPSTKEETTVETKTDDQSPAPSSSSPVTLDVRRVTVSNSRFALRDPTGKVTLLKVDNLMLEKSGLGYLVQLNSDFNDTPVVVSAKIGTMNPLSPEAWPLSATILYANDKINIDGKVSEAAKVIDIKSYTISSGASDIHGQLLIKLNKSKPSLKGEILSTRLNPSDFKAPPSKENLKEAESKVKSTDGSSEPVKLFSGSPLGLDKLKSADVDLTIKIDEFSLGSSPLHDITGSLTLVNGKLALDQNVQLKSGAVKIKAAVDGDTNPAKISASIEAPKVDLGELLPIFGLDSFVSASANTAMNITSSGDSLHELASHLNGSMDIISDGGRISTKALGDISSGLAQLVTLGASGDTIGLNCAATRFVIKDGIMTDRGVLADTIATTVLLKGGVDFGSEVIDMTVNAKPKVARVASFVPPVSIHGTLLKPNFKVDPLSVVASISGLLSGQKAPPSVVPALQSSPGQNSCVYTLDHPQASAASQANTLPGLSGKTGDKVKSLGNNLLKGLLGQ